MFKFTKKALSFVLALSMMLPFVFCFPATASANDSQIISIKEISGKEFSQTNANNVLAVRTNDKYRFEVITTTDVVRLDFWYHLKNSNTWVNAGTEPGETVFMTVPGGVSNKLIQQTAHPKNQ